MKFESTLIAATRPDPDVVLPENKVGNLYFLYAKKNGEYFFFAKMTDILDLKLCIKF